MIETALLIAIWAFGAAAVHGGLADTKFKYPSMRVSLAVVWPATLIVMLAAIIGMVVSKDFDAVR